MCFRYKFNLTLMVIISLFFFSSAALSAEEKNTEQTEQKKQIESVLSKSTGILLPRGRIVIAPSISHTHFSRNVISISGFTIFEALVIGRIEVKEIRRDIITGKLTLRYGLLNRLQWDFDLPYQYRRDREINPEGASTGGGEERVRIIDGASLGDVQSGFVLHAGRALGWDLMLNTKVKTRSGKDPYHLATELIGDPAQGQVPATSEVPTGTGHYGVSFGISVVKATDPVVFFGSLNYFVNLKRNLGADFGVINPGDSVEYSLGLALALTERASINFSLQNIFTFQTRQNSVRIRESEVNSSSFLVGSSFRFSKRYSLSISVGIGLTADSPDYQIHFSLPLSFM